MEWYLTVWRKFAVFSGRARRREYWQFTLANILITVVAAGIDAVLFEAVPGRGLLAGLYSLAVLVPTLAVTVRRLHDTDRPGWWWFVVFVPFVGGLVLLVLLALDGTPGDNRYGGDPKGRTAPGGSG